MALVTELDVPEFDYFDETLRGERFHATMADLAARSWVAKAPLGYIVLDREAGNHLLRTKATTFPGMKIAELFEITEGPLYEEMRRNILHINGADHARLRGLVNPAFTPRSADRWRPAMRGFAEGLLAPMLDAGRCEFVEDFAKLYPSQVIATVMGAPLSDAPRLHHWSNWIQRQFDGPSLIEDRALIEEACQEFYDWARPLIVQRRATPGDDLISTLIAARDGDDRLDDDELVNLVLNVLVGGVDTTQSQLAHAVRLLAEHPDQWAALRADPSLAAAAADETLRYEPITPFTSRIMLEDVEVNDVTFPEGTIVMVSAFNANRDAGTIDAPDTFDITADRGAAKPLTFGAGIHYCLGANLARAEMQEALTLFAERVATLELDGDAELGSIQGIYGVDRLPLRLAAA
jgi:cytochrome P450